MQAAKAKVPMLAEASSWGRREGVQVLGFRVQGSRFRLRLKEFRGFREFRECRE